jgi:hypothetical protein
MHSAAGLRTNGCMGSKDFIQLLRYYVWSNKPSSWVVNCLGLVERSDLGNKGSMVVQGRSLCARF